MINPAAALAAALAEFSEVEVTAIAAALGRLRPSTVEYVAEYVSTTPDAARAITNTMPTALLEVAHQMRRVGSSTPTWPACPKCSQPAHMWRIGPDATRECRRCCDNRTRGTCTLCGKSRQLRIHGAHRALVCRACAEQKPREQKRCIQCDSLSTLGTVSPAGFTCVKCGPRREGRCEACRQWRPMVTRMFGGFVCSSCFLKVTRTAENCPGCGSTRILSERGAAGQAICAGCAGVPARYQCTRCGSEENRTGSLCGRCALDDTLTRAFGAPGTSVASDALRAHFTSRASPRDARNWIERSIYLPFLSDIARGTIPANHSSIDTLPDNRKTQFVRELLIECGIVPPIDLELHSLEMWVTEFASSLPSHHAGIIRNYAAWSVLHRLRRVSELTALRKTQTRGARNAFRAVSKLLAWLDEHELTLAEFPQGALETYWAQTRHDQTLGAFISWSRKAHGTPATAPSIRNSVPSPRITEAARLSVYRAIIADPRPARIRLACGLVVVFGLQLERVSRMTPQMFRDTGQTVEVLIRPRKPTPLPGPLADLYRAYVAESPEPREWFWPGRRFHRHITPGALSTWLRPFGEASTDLRVAALTQLAGAMSSRILSEATGIGATAAQGYVSVSGSAWNEIPDLYPNLQTLGS